MVKSWILAGMVAALGVPALAGAPDLDLRNNIIFDAAPRGPVGSMERLVRGQAVFIEGMVVNRGDLPAHGVGVEVRVNGRILDRRELGIIRRGMQQAFSISWVPEAEGTYTVTVIVDPDHKVDESNENNNRREESTRIAFLREDGSPSETDSNPPRAAREDTPAAVEKPDLRIVGEVGVWPRPIVGRTSNITVTVENRGASASEACEVEVRIAGVRHASRTLPRLRPGERSTISVGWTPGRRRSFQILALADARNRVAESDESNNREQVRVEAQAR